MKHYLKTTLRRQLAGWAAAAAVAATLAACGGGGGDVQTTSSNAGTPPPTQASVPPSAVVDVAAFIGYLNTLATSDSQDPLLTDAVTLPTSETGEPTAI